MSDIDSLIVRVHALEAQLQQERHYFQQVINQFPAVIYLRDVHGYFTMVNKNYARIVNCEPEDLVGKQGYDLFPEEISAVFRENDRRVLETGEVLDFPKQAPHDDGMRSYRSIKFPIRDEQGTIIGIGGISIDITDQQQIIETQREKLRELSTPLIPLTDQVVIMPLIGTIDSQRAQQIMEALLMGVAQYQSELVIIDITGVQVVDTQVAQAIVSAAQAVRLLGAKVMLTGIQPQIAQTLVHLGIDLSGIDTRSSLQAGIAAALRNLA